MTEKRLRQDSSKKSGIPSPKATGNQVPMQSLETSHTTATTETVRRLLAHHSATSGFRVLFHGPAGGGQAATVALLGKETGRAVMRVDLSQLISKYIGETEKNLTRLFERAQHANAILFFDEADALFGKRTEIKDAHDKYANQEVSYAMQRIEHYNGIIVFAMRHRPSIDNPLLRRMQTVMPFPVTG